MTEQGIIMSAECVRAILAGRKTQTQRVITPQPQYYPEREVWHWVWRTGRHTTWSTSLPPTQECPLRCPYGGPGDRLWVRETWGIYGSNEGTNSVVYRADGEMDGIRWRSPIHMPRWASRIALGVTGVRVGGIPGRGMGAYMRRVGGGGRG